MPPMPPMCSRAAALALALCLIASAHARLYSATYTQAKYDNGPIKWNSVFKAAIPDGQCTGQIDVDMVCRDKKLPNAIAWEISVNATRNPFIRMSGPRAAEVLRSEMRYPPPEHCAGAVIVTTRALCTGLTAAGGAGA